MTTFEDTNSTQKDDRLREPQQRVTLAPSTFIQKARSLLRGQALDEKSYAGELRKLVTSSGVYALASVASPLISLVLAPFLAHNLSPSDYGALAILSTAISLTSGITQLGLASAFFRAYSYDFTEEKDRRDVIATTTTLLCLISLPVALLVALLSTGIAYLLFGQSMAGNDVLFAAGVVCLQNLTVPGLAWLRAEKRALAFSLLFIANLLVTLFATILLLGLLHWGVAGAVIANGAGYACIVICTLPVIIARSGIKIRKDIAWNLLSFGSPLILNFVAYWVLQLSDRYLLTRFTSLAETARYAVAYSLGSAISVLVMGPFAIAWPATVFTIAKRDDAAYIFKIIFRWFSLFLLFMSFALSLAGVLLLNWLFPTTYRSAAFVIPLVATSITFYGIYYIFKSGLDIKRKTWVISIYTSIAALVNVSLNLLLIPRYGAMGAAASTLIAYIVLAALAYSVNRRMYPVPFEIGLFSAALLVGGALYIGSAMLSQSQGTVLAWGIRIGALILYAGYLAGLGMFLLRKQQKEHASEFAA